MRQVRRRFVVEWVLMFLLLPSAIVWLDNKPGLAEANAALYDRILLHRPPAPADDILIVGIDKRSLDALGSWPFPRSLHARLLDQLSRHAPKAVLLDIFLDGPSINPEDDRLLADALSRLPVYLPLNYVPSLQAQPDARPAFTPPIPLLANAARGVGHANATPDSDGLVRGIWRFEGTNTKLWPYVGALIAAGNESMPGTDKVTRDQTAGWLRQGRFNIPFAGSAGTYPTVPYLDVLRGDILEEMVRGKLVLIGALSNSGLGDTMPVAGIGALTSLPGVEIHANAVDALRRDLGIEVPADWRRVLWISAPIWAALVLFLRTAGHAVTITLAIAMLCAASNYSALVYWHTGLPLASPLFGIALAYLLWSWRRLNALLVFFRERAEVLNAVPAGAFEPPVWAEPLPVDSVERRTHALDRAIERLTRLQSILTEGMWQLPIPVLICRSDGVISQSNAAARALLIPATSSSTTTARKDATDELRGIDLPRILIDLSKIELPGTQSGKIAIFWEHAVVSEFTTRQGNVFRLRAAPLSTSDDPSASGWIVVLPDVTTERRAQREREQWFGFLSHDLRGPQVTILSLLGLYAEGEPNISISDLIKGVESEARRTIHLAESFMDMVEAESGVYRFAPSFAGSVVLDAIDATWSAANARGITLSPRLGAPDCVVLADASLLARALVNLLNNAIRASRAASTIHVCLETDLDANGGQGEAVISVQDQGSGMNANQIAKVMRTDEPHNTSSRPGGREAGKGWGIGMAIVHAVVARHGGWIDVVSAPDAGTTFLIGVPLTEDDQRTQD